MKLKVIVLSSLLSLSAYSADRKFFGQEYPPLNYTDGGAIKGAIVDIVNDVCTKIGEKCTFELQPLKRLMQSLETGEAQAVVSLIKTAERDAVADQVGPIFKANQIIWVEKTVDFQLDQIKGKTGVALTNSGSLKLLKETIEKNGGGATVFEESDNETMIKKLSAGRYGAGAFAIGNDAVFSFLMNKLSIANLKQAQNLKSESFNIYFSKKNQDPAFVKKFTEAIDKMKADGSLKKILDKYKIESP